MWKWVTAAAVLVMAAMSYAAVNDWTSADGASPPEERDDSSNEKPGARDDWANSYCPNALPASENPYLAITIEYNRQGKSKKEYRASRKAEQYTDCKMLSEGAATNALLGNQVHQQVLRKGTQAQIDFSSKEATKARFQTEFSGPYHRTLVAKSFELGYADPSNRPVQDDIDAIVRKTFCDCLMQPTETYLEEN